MSKGFKGKTCAYCGKPESSETEDHVFARGFFPEAYRANLPKVPACGPCNNEKSKLEHYLASVLPFGGRSPQSSDILNRLVPPRLEKNQKLHHVLAEGQSRELVDEDGQLREVMAVPFESEKLTRLLELVAKGLVAHHAASPLPEGVHVACGMVTAAGEQVFAPYFAMNGHRFSGAPGGGLFEYEGVQSIEHPATSIWRFRVYGGLKAMGDPAAPGELATTTIVITNGKPFPNPFVQ